MNDTAGEQVDDIWSRLKQGLLSATKKTCELTQRKAYKKIYERVSKDISEKRKLQKLWKGGWSKDKYLDTKQKARHAVYTEKEKFANVKYNKENIFSVAKQMRTENQDVI